MNKVSKKQKLVIKLIIIILIVIGFKPFLQQIEMWRSDDYLKKSYFKSDVDWPTIFVERTVDEQFENHVLPTGTLTTVRDNRQNDEYFGSSCKLCDKRKNFRVLSTQKDQDLIRKGFEEEKKQGSDGKIKFKDFNQDGINDVFIQINYTSSSDIMGNDYFIYSSDNNQMLWGFTKETTYGQWTSEPEIKFIYQKNQSPLIVIYDPGYAETTKSYSFYKVVDSKYQQVKPTWSDWIKYWRAVSISNVVGRFFNTSPDVGVLFMLMFLSKNTQTITILLLIVVLFLILKIKKT